MAAEQQGIEWVTLSNAAEVFRRDEAAAKKLADSYVKLSKSVDTTTAAGRREAAELAKVGAATVQVAQKLGAEARVRERAIQLVRQHGLAMQIAVRVSRDLERAGGALTAEVIRQAKAFDTAERQVRELAAAQRRAAGTSFTAALNQQSAALAALKAQLGFLLGVGGFLALKRGVEDVVDAYREDIRASAQIEARLASTQNAIGLTADEFKRYATEIQATTGVGDEIIKEQEGVLLSFTNIARENFQAATAASLDMSLALGTDLRSNVIALGKALDDPVRGITALRRGGTTFSAEQQKVIKTLAETGRIAEAQAIILKEVQRQYGGTAKAIREAVGPSEAIASEWGDLKEKIGELIYERGGLRDFQERWLSTIKDLNKGFDSSALATVLLRVIDLVGDLGNIADGVAKAWWLVSAVIVVIAARNIPALISAWETLYLRMLLISNTLPMWAGLAIAIYAVSKAVEYVRDSYAAAIDRITQSTRDWRAAEDELTAAIESGNAALQGRLSTDYAAQAAEAEAKLARARIDIANATRQLAEAEAALNRAREQGASDAPGIAGEAQRARTNYDGLKKAVDDARAALEAAQRAQGEATIESRSAKAALDQLAEALANVRRKNAADLTDEQAKALAHLVDALDKASRAARAHAKEMSSEADTLHLGARASAQVAKELEIQGKVADKLAEAQAKGVAGTEAFQKALEEFEASLRAEAAAEQYLAGAKTIQRLEQAVKAELALAAGSRAAVKELELQAEIAAAVAAATDDQATAIEALVRRLQALKIAREQATNLRALRDEVVELQRANAARGAGVEAYQAYIRQRELEEELQKRIVTGLPLETALIIALIQAKQREAQVAVNQEALQNLDQELAAWQLKLKVLQEAIAKGLSYAKAMREVAIAERTAQILRDNPNAGLDPNVVRAQVTAIYDASAAYEQSANRLQNNAGQMAQATGQMLDQLATAFETIGGEFGDMVATLLRLVDTIYQAAQAMQAANAASNGGGGGGGGAGASTALAGLSAVGAVIGVFVALYQIGSALIDKANAKKYSLPIEGGVSNAQFQGQAIASGAAGLTQTQTNEAVAAFRQAIEGFERVLGQSLDFFPTLGIEVQNSGDKFRLTVGGVVHGIFESFDAAFQAGFRIALGAIEAADIGPNLSRALGRFGVSTEELVEIIPLLTRFDDALKGIPAGLSSALLAQRQWFTALDQQSKLLLRAGVSLETVIEWRREEIAAMIEQVRQGGLQLAGVRSFGAGLQEWIDAMTATGEAAVEETKRQKGLEESADKASDALVGGGRGGTAGSLDSATGSADGLTSSTVAMSGAMDGGRGAIDDSADAAAKARKAFIEMVREIVRLEAAQSVFQELLDFQERTGIQIADSAVLRDRIAQIEFRLFQLRFQQTVLELIAAQELLGLTRAQINEFTRWADAVAGLDYGDVRVGGGGGRRQQQRETRATALEDWNEQLAEMADLLAGLTPQEIALARAREELTEKGKAAGKTTEEIAAALSMLAQLQVADIVAPWEELAKAAGESDAQTAYRQAGERAAQALAEAAAAAVDDPDLYEAARRAIAAGLDAELRKLGQDTLASLGGVSAAAAASFQSFLDTIAFLAEHGPELGITFRDIARSVREGILPGLLDLAIAEAERVGDTNAANALRREAEALERAFLVAKLIIIRQELEAAGVLDAHWARVIDQTIARAGEADVAVRELGESEEELAKTRRDLAGSLFGRIEELARTAGVELPVDMAREWAQVQYNLARAELLVALSSQAVIDAFAQMPGGLERLATWQDFVLGLPDTLPPLAEDLDRVTTAAGQADTGIRRFVLGLGLVEEGAEGAGRTLAEIIDDMLYDAMSPPEKLFTDWQRLIAEIMAAEGTEEERLRALQLAEEQYDRARMQLLEDAFQAVNDLLDNPPAVVAGTLSQQLDTSTAKVTELAAAAATGDLDAAAALGEEAARAIDLIQRIYGAAGAPLVQQILDALAAARAAAGLAAPAATLAAAPPTALTAPNLQQLSLPPVILPSPGAIAATVQADKIADLTAVVDALRAEGAADRQHRASMVKIQLGNEDRNFGVLVPAVQALGAVPLRQAPTGTRV